jgi:putative toxin-antitoxin system antitoxin component (TIGR02293 family)
MATVYSPRDSSYLDAQPIGLSTTYIVAYDKLSYFFDRSKGSMVSEPSPSLSMFRDTDFEFTDIKPLIDFFRFTQQQLAELFELDASTLSRWKKSPKPIGRLRSRLVRELDLLVAKGVHAFGSEAAFQSWLATPNVAMGSLAPGSLLVSPEGVLYVLGMLDSFSWGNFS